MNWFLSSPGRRQPPDRRRGHLHGRQRLAALVAQRTIPIGTAYAIWTGIGAAGTFLVGVLIYGDPSSLARYAGVALIITGTGHRTARAYDGKPTGAPLLHLEYTTG